MRLTRIVAAATTAVALCCSGTVVAQAQSGPRFVECINGERHVMIKDQGYVPTGESCDKSDDPSGGYGKPEAPDTPNAEEPQEPSGPATSSSNDGPVRSSTPGGEGSSDETRSVMVTVLPILAVTAGIIGIIAAVHHFFPSGELNVFYRPPGWKKR